MSTPYINTLAALRDEHALALEAVLRRARDAEELAAHAERMNAKLRADIVALQEGASERAATVHAAAVVLLDSDAALTRQELQGDIVSKNTELAALRTQLAAVTAERDELLVRLEQRDAA